MRCSITESMQFALQVYALHARLLATFPGEINSLLPRHVNHWWPLVEDIFMSPRIKSLEQELKAELVHHEEFEVVSIDATLRCCLPIMGQAHPRASCEEKNASSFSWRNSADSSLLVAPMPIFCFAWIVCCISQQ